MRDAQDNARHNMRISKHVTHMQLLANETLLDKNHTRMAYLAPHDRFKGFPCVCAQRAYVREFRTTSDQVGVE